MGNKIDCFYSTRQYNQCFFPCIRTCSYSNRRIFYNFDGMESVQPLIDIYFPEKGAIQKFPDGLQEVNKDDEVAGLLQKGLHPADQLAAICRFASKNNYRVRAVGTGSSWSRLTSTRDILIDMTSLKRILTPRPRRRMENMTKEHVDIEVEGGMTVVDFVQKLDAQYGLALPTMGNYAGQTVAGVANTSTHGSGYFAGTLSTGVVAVHLITSRGIQVKVSGGHETFDQCRQKLQAAEFGGEPVDLQSDEILRAVSVGLGSLGIIYTVTYRCIPVFNLEEERKIVEIPWPSNHEDFRIRERFATMFTEINDGEFFSFFLNPYPQPRRFLYAAYLKSKRTSRRPTCCACCSCWCCCGGRGCADCALVQTDCTASCLQSCAYCCPQRIPDITNFGLSQYSLTTPFVQKWYNVLQFTGGNIHVRTAEWCLPLDQLDAALGDVIETCIHYAEKHAQYSLLPLYVRIVKADDLYLSPANRNCPCGATCEHYCYIEVPFLPGAFGIEEFHKTIEDLLFEKYKARPHWGKNHHLSFTRVHALYPELASWKKVFQLFNDAGTFCNQFTQTMGFDVFLEDVVKTTAALRAGLPADAITAEPISNGNNIRQALRSYSNQGLDGVEVEEYERLP